MLQRELIDSTQIEDGVCLELYRHGTDFMIVLGRNELMSTRMRFSEEQLAQLTIERLGKDSNGKLSVADIHTAILTLKTKCGRPCCASQQRSRRHPPCPARNRPRASWRRLLRAACR